MGRDVPSRGRRLAGLTLLCVVALGVYAGTLSHTLLEDDPLLVDYVSSLVEERGVAGLLSADFRQNPLLPLGYYRPVILLSFHVDQVLSGGSPFLFHLTNILLHLLCCLLVFRLLEILLDRSDVSLMGALLFAVHPIHTGSVAFVSGRTDLWAALFVLASAVAWLRVRQGMTRRPGLETALGGVALALAILSKELAFMAPAVFMAWDLILPVSGPEPSGAGKSDRRDHEARTGKRDQRGRPGRLAPSSRGSASPGAWLPRNLRWLLSWGSAVAAALVLRYGLAGTGFGVGSTGMTPSSVPGLTRADALLTLGSWLTYLKLLLVSWPMNVAYMDMHVGITVLTVTGALGLIFICYLARGKVAHRAGLLGLVWIVLFLLPVSGIVPLTSYHLHERFLYLPSVGLSIAVGGLLLWLFSRPVFAPRPVRLAVWGIAAILVVTMGAQTVLRAAVWKDEISLWSQAVENQPESWVGHFYLAKARMQAGETQKAIEGFERASRMAGEFAQAYMELGFAYAGAGRHQDALAALVKAREINPDLPAASFNVGVAYRTLGMHRQAAEAFRSELERSAGNPEVHYELALALVNAGDLPGALAAADDCLRLVPGSADAHLLRGMVLVQMGQMGEAARELEILRGVDPERAEVLRRSLEQASAGR
jgi:tetratricopeptide (TPR) repeat protein